jgi:hypothetical protein
MRRPKPWPNLDTESRHKTPQLTSPLPRTLSTSLIAAWRLSTTNPPRSLLLPHGPPLSHRQEERPAAHLRCGRCALFQNYLCMIGKARTDRPECAECPDTLRHVLDECPAFRHRRIRYFTDDPRRLPSTNRKPVLRFVQSVRRKPGDMVR